MHALMPAPGQPLTAPLDSGCLSHLRWHSHPALFPWAADERMPEVLTALERAHAGALRAAGAADVAWEREGMRSVSEGTLPMLTMERLLSTIWPRLLSGDAADQVKRSPGGLQEAAGECELREACQHLERPPPRVGAFQGHGVHCWSTCLPLPAGHIAPPAGYPAAPSPRPSAPQVSAHLPVTRLAAAFLAALLHLAAKEGAPADFLASSEALHGMGVLSQSLLEDDYQDSSPAGSSDGFPALPMGALGALRVLAWMSQVCFPPTFSHTWELAAQ